VIGHVRGIVRMSIAQLGDNGFEGIEHVQVGSWIEIRSGQRSGGVQHGELTDPGCGRLLEQRGLDLVGDVYDFALAVRFDVEALHSVLINHRGTEAQRKMKNDKTEMQLQIPRS